jgi:hypothetical protein
LTAGRCLERLHLGCANRFEPDGLRRFQPFRLRRSGVPLQAPFQACLACGFVWSRLSPDDLRALIEKYGTEESKGRLPGPPPG